jgi:hypothetical protein
MPASHMPSLAYLASNADNLDIERYEIERVLARQGAVNISFPCRDDGEGYDWNLSRQQIEKAEFFILLIGDTYGPVSPIGISYLHREYVHARTLGLPVLAFVKTSSSASADEQTRLQGFRQLVTQQVSQAKVWHLRDELLAHVASSVSSQLARVSLTDSAFESNDTGQSSSSALPWKGESSAVNSELATTTLAGESLAGESLRDPQPGAAYGAPADMDTRQPQNAASIESPFSGAAGSGFNSRKVREASRQILELEIEAKVYKGGNLSRENTRLLMRLDELQKILMPVLSSNISEDRLKTHAESSINGLITTQLLELHTGAHAVDDVRINKKQFQSILSIWHELGAITPMTANGRTYWAVNGV